MSRQSPYDWKATVRAVFAEARRKPRLRIVPVEELAPLEQALLRTPINEDGSIPDPHVAAVSDVALKVRRRLFELGWPMRPPRPCRWSRDGTVLRLVGMQRVDDLLGFFLDPKWADGLAGPGPVRLVSEPRPLATDEVRLSTTEAFKGLEADHVFLLVAGDREELAKHLYVGVSRARGSLHLVVNRELEQRAPHLPLFQLRAPDGGVTRDGA